MFDGYHMQTSSSLDKTQCSGPLFFFFFFFVNLSLTHSDILLPSRRCFACFFPRSLLDTIFPFFFSQVASRQHSAWCPKARTVSRDVSTFCFLFLPMRSFVPKVLSLVYRKNRKKTFAADSYAPYWNKAFPHVDFGYVEPTLERH